MIFLTRSRRPGPHLLCRVAFEIAIKQSADVELGLMLGGMVRIKLVQTDGLHVPLGGMRLDQCQRSRLSKQPILAWPQFLT